MDLGGSVWWTTEVDEERLKWHDLSDEDWQRLEPLPPSTVPQRGGWWADHRMVINGVFFRTCSGTAWRDLPPVYGNWKTVYNRQRRWSLDGTWEGILDRLRAGCDEAEGADWTVSADSTITRAHQGDPAPCAGPSPHTSWPGHS